MRIAIVDQFGEIGGAQRCLLDLLPAFLARGWQVAGGTPAGQMLDRLREMCEVVRELPCGPFSSGQKTAADVARMIWQVGFQCRRINAISRGADVIYANGPRILPAV